MPAKKPAQTRASAVDNALRGMFKRLEARPAPDHIMTVVDQLEAAAEAERNPKKKTG